MTILVLYVVLLKVADPIDSRRGPTVVLLRKLFLGVTLSRSSHSDWKEEKTKAWGGICFHRLSQSAAAAFLKRPSSRALKCSTHAGRGGRCHRHHPLSLMQVEFCKSFGDPTKPRAWSKHAQKPSQSKQPSKNKDAVPQETKKVRRRSLAPACSVSGLSPLGGVAGQAGGAGMT